MFCRQRMEVRQASPEEETPPRKKTPVLSDFLRLVT